jgi:hypothetical protein
MGSSTFLRSLRATLWHDEQRRQPVVSLPGRFPSAPAASDRPRLNGAHGLHTTPLPVARQRAHHEYGGVGAGEPEPDDICGPYLHEQLVRMDAAFVEAMQRAFQRGKESPFSARAVWRRPSKQTGR